MPPTGLPLRQWGRLYATNGAPSQTMGTVVTPPQLPLLDQIWDSPLNKKGAEVSSPPRDARNVTVPHWRLAQVH